MTIELNPEQNPLHIPGHEFSTHCFELRHKFCRGRIGKYPNLVSCKCWCHYYSAKIMILSFGFYNMENWEN